MLQPGVADWPKDVQIESFTAYEPRALASLGLWCSDEWAVKAYGIQLKSVPAGAPLIEPEIVDAARRHVVGLLPQTEVEGAFYKTGFAILHQGAMANWLLFQWWTHTDVWCQFLSYSDVNDPEAFGVTQRPIRACVYETAVIWHEQLAWIRHVLNGSPDRQAYLSDVKRSATC